VIDAELLADMRATAEALEPEARAVALELLNVYADYQPMVKQRDHFREKAKAAEYALAEMRDLCDDEGMCDTEKEQLELLRDRCEAERLALAEPYKP
jgi:hypothetical protein